VVIDIDIKGLNCEKVMNAPIKKAVQQVRQRAVELELKDASWQPEYVTAVGSRWESDGTFKYSAHVVFQDLSAVSRPALLHFMEPVCKDNATVDRSIYASKTSQMFRFINSYKWTDKTKTPMIPVRQWSTGQTVDKNFLISNPEVDTIVIKQTAPTTKKRKKLEPANNTNKNPNAFNENDIVLNELMKRFPSNKIEHKKVDRFSSSEPKDTYYIYHSPDVPCPIAGRLHSGTNNSVVEINDNGDAWLYCFSSSCKHKLFLFNTTLMQTRKGIDVWKQGVDVKTKSPDNLGRITPFEWNHFQKCLVVCAGMSSGKTHQLRLEVTKQAPKRMLIVTSRIQLANTMKSNFPRFQMYNDDINADWLICQYESLHRIRANQPFDMVISDEFRSTCNNITSVKTNHRFLQDNAAAMQFFMQTATKTILLDADAEIDGMVSDVLSGIFQPHQIRVERYEHSRMKRNYMILDKMKWWQDLEDDAKGNIEKGITKKKIGVPCRTKKDAQTINAKCEEWGLKTKIYTSLEDDVVMRDFLDIDVAWRDVDVVVFSSKVVVGADCQIKFDRVYIHADARGGCTAREMNQMTGRFRNLGDATIRVLVSENFESSFHSYEDCLQFYDDRRKTIQDMISGYIRFYPEFTRYGQIWAPDHVTSAFAHARSERSKNFRSDLLQIAVDKGYAVMFETPSPIENEVQLEKELEDFYLSMAISAKDWEKNMYNKLLDKYRDKATDADARIRKQEGTAVDRLVCEMDALLKHYPDDPPPSYEDYRLIRKHRLQIKNIAAVENKMDHVYLAEHDMKKFDKCPWADVASVEPFTQIYIELDTIMKLLGFGHIFDTQHRILSAALIQHKDAVKQKCKKISILRAERWVEPTGTNAAAQVKSMVSKQLKAVFATTIVRNQIRIPGSRKKVSEYTIEKIEEVHKLAEKSDYYKQIQCNDNEFIEPQVPLLPNPGNSPQITDESKSYSPSNSCHLTTIRQQNKIRKIAGFGTQLIQTKIHQ
jgi:hypothetical protein